MKFTDGYWMLKDGVTKYSPVEVRDYEIDNNEVTLYVADVHIVDRGQTLNRALFTIKLSSPQCNVIRVQAEHHTGGTRISPTFEINESKNHKIEINDSEDEIIFVTGDTKAVVSKKEWNLSFYYKDKYLTSSKLNQMGYLRTNEGNYWREQLDLAIGECVYGLGERFSQFVKNGQSIDTWNEDGGTCSDLAYKSIPFYYTNKGYGVFVNQTGKVSFEVASEVVSRCQFSVEGEKIDYMIIGGEEPKDAIKGYTDVTGKPSLPPAWSFGLWLSTSFTTNYDEETVTSFVNGMIERDLPLNVFHFDCFWMKEYEWCSFEWDRKAFPDPEGMIKRLKEKGLKICVWINPYIGQKAKIFKEAKENGYFIKNKEGGVWQWDMWQAGQGIVDFTNEEACKWYTEKLDKLIDMGIDCFKTDFGERIPTDGVYSNGADANEMHNFYAYLYNKVVFEHLEKRMGKDKAILFARSASVGGQKFPVHWGGDCESRFESMAESLRGGLSLVSSGFGFWSHDIGGFEKTSTADTYKRWVQFGLLSSHSRLHGSSSYRVPWLYDEEAVDVLRKFTNLKCRLMPYIFHNAVIANEIGHPVMRPMVMEFPADKSCDYLERQYMFGKDILVAPILNSDSTVEYYLPAGKWTNIITNEEVIGGRWVREKHSYLTLPIMVRENSLIAFGSNESKTDYDYLDGIELHLFNINNKCEATVNDINGEVVLVAKAEKCGNKIKLVLTDHQKEIKLVTRNLYEIKNLKAGTIEKTSTGSIITIPQGINEIEFEV